MFWECSTSSYDVSTFWLKLNMPCLKGILNFCFPSHPHHNNWDTRKQYTCFPIKPGLVIVPQFHVLYRSHFVRHTAHILNISFTHFHSSDSANFTAYRVFWRFPIHSSSFNMGPKIGSLMAENNHQSGVRTFGHKT